MKLPEMQRLLNSIDCDPRLKHAILILQEQTLAQQDQLDTAANVLVRVVKTLENLQRVNLELNARWENRLRGQPDQEMVESVLPDPEDVN